MGLFFDTTDMDKLKAVGKKLFGTWQEESEEENPNCGEQNGKNGDGGVGGANGKVGAAAGNGCDHKKNLESKNGAENNHNGNNRNGNGVHANGNANGNGNGASNNHQHNLQQQPQQPQQQQQHSKYAQISRLPTYNGMISPYDSAPHAMDANTAVYGDQGDRNPRSTTLVSMPIPAVQDTPSNGSNKNSDHPSFQEFCTSAPASIVPPPNRCVTSLPHTSSEQ